MNISEKAQFALIGIVFHPQQEEPWTVQDNRKALKSEFPCRTKADVLEKIAEMLDDMHSPPSQLNRTTQPVELTVAVTFQASLCDLEDEVNTLDVRRAAAEAVENAIHHCEDVGFNHTLADRMSLEAVEYRTFNVENGS
jgi:hypothetical protein